MDAFQSFIASLSKQDLDNGKLIFYVLFALLLFSSYFILTKEGRSQLGRAFRPFLIVFLILGLMSIGGIFAVDAASEWLSTSTDPDVIGRQPDKIAPIGVDVRIDGYSIHVHQPTIVKNCKTPDIVTSGQHIPTWCEVTVFATFTCELSGSDQCHGPLVIWTEDKEGEQVYRSNSTIVGNEETLRGGETIVFEQKFEMDLNRPAVYLGTDAGEKYLHLVVMGPDGRSLNRHRAYLALGQSD